MYLAFLDIDGVFTSNRVQTASANPREMWDKFDPVAISFMNRLHNQIIDLRFVLISTWKNGLKNDDMMTYHWMLSSFRNAGFDGQFNKPWKTDPDNLRKFPNRSYEIKDYLETFATDCKDYIIFDDNDYAFEKVLGRKRLIRTDPVNGMLHKHMLNALSMVGNWDYK